MLDLLILKKHMIDKPSAPKSEPESASFECKIGAPWEWTKHRYPDMVNFRSLLVKKPVETPGSKWVHAATCSGAKLFDLFMSAKTSKKYTRIPAKGYKIDNPMSNPFI